MSAKPKTIKRQHSQIPKTSQYWEKLKNVEIKKISQYKTKETNLKMRHYWSDVIREMERLAMQQAEQTKVKINDLSTSLPPQLYKRISKIIKLKPIQDDHFEDEFEEKPKTNERNYNDLLIYKKNDNFNESTCTFINDQERVFHDVVAHVEERTVKKEKKNVIKNWQSEYLCQKQKDRIKWNSKLYQLNADIWEKPLYEQAEELMDSGVGYFMDWLNNLSDLSETNMTKDVLKSLFSLEVSSFLASGIHIEPKIMGAVPAAVAATWNMPNKSIEAKLERTLKAINNRILPKKILTHAFGATIPNSMRPWIPSDSYNVIKPDMPKEVRECKVLFEGITHLKTTKSFVNHCKENPDIERPPYLKKIGCFDENEDMVKSNNSFAPLRELLHLNEI